MQEQTARSLDTLAWTPADKSARCTLVWLFPSYFSARFQLHRNRMRAQALGKKKHTLFMFPRPPPPTHTHREGHPSLPALTPLYH